MAAITDVTLTAGVPTAGTGTVTTLDKFDSAAGVSASRALTVQGIASGTAMPVSLASVPSHAVTNAGTFVTQENGAGLTALQLIDDNMVAQSTALGTTKNALIGGSVTTSAPTYTTGNINPLSLDTSGALRVTGAGGGTQYTEDAAAATDPVGNMMMAVRRDTLSVSEVSADGDNIAIKATSKGKIHTASETRFGDVAADTGSGTGGSATQRVIIDSGQLGSLGQTTSSASAPVVIASDQTALTTQLASTANLVSGVISTAMTSTTSTSLVAAPGASLRNYITQITVSNSHATVGTDVIIQDGSGGTTLYVIPAAAVYGGATITFPAPLRQPTTNTALFCANVTTGSSTKVSASGFKAA